MHLYIYLFLHRYTRILVDTITYTHPNRHTYAHSAYISFISFHYITLPYLTLHYITCIGYTTCIAYITYITCGPFISVFSLNW